MIKTVLVAALFSVAFSFGASASPFCVPTGDIMRPCAYQPNFLAGVRSIKVRMHRVKRSAIQRAPEAQQTTSYRGEVIGGRPAGCPHAFCGCGASLHIFGRIIPALNLAANWLKFPRAEPAPGMAAARVGHVMVLERHISGSIWLVHDSNSGHGLTHLHERSIAGFVVVNPRAASL